MYVLGEEGAKGLEGHQQPRRKGLPCTGLGLWTSSPGPRNPVPPAEPAFPGEQGEDQWAPREQCPREGKVCGVCGGGTQGPTQDHAKLSKFTPTACSWGKPVAPGHFLTNWRGGSGSPRAQLLDAIHYSSLFWESH
jgi:hypothetical protein